LPDCRLRPATLDDVPRLTAIAEAAYAPYVPRMGKKPAPMIADFAAHVRAAAGFVAEAGGVIAGYIVTFLKSSDQFIENVAVDPAWHGKGIGHRLIQFAEQDALRHGAARIFLYTNIHMTENLDFYPKLGYVETHRVREHGFDRVYFEKRLTHER